MQISWRITPVSHRQCHKIQFFMWAKNCTIHVAQERTPTNMELGSSLKRWDSLFACYFTNKRCIVKTSQISVLNHLWYGVRLDSSTDDASFNRTMLYYSYTCKRESIFLPAPRLEFEGKSRLMQKFLANCHTTHVASEWHLWQLTSKPAYKQILAKVMFPRLSAKIKDGGFGSLFDQIAARRRTRDRHNQRPWSAGKFVYKSNMDISHNWPSSMKMKRLEII